MDAGSEAGDNLDGSGALPTSSILVSMVCWPSCYSRSECVEAGRNDDKWRMKMSGKAGGPW